MPLPKKKNTNKAKKAPARNSKGDCIVPPQVKNEAINQFAFKRDNVGAQRVIEDVEWQCGKDRKRGPECVTFVELISTEHVMDTPYQCDY